MNSSSTHRSNLNISNLYNAENCDCFCHYPEDMDLSNQNSIIHQSIPQNSRTSIHREISSKKIINQNKNDECLCICDEVCSCPCHCVSCLCCPCVKDRKGDDFYKNLYVQIKSQLDIEKRRNDRMKFDKEMSIKNSEKENKNLIIENSKLKQQLSEALAQLEQEQEKNEQRDEELYNFKNDEFPRLQESYENLIKSIKEEKDKQIIEMNNKMADLAKENVSLKYQLKRKQEEHNVNMDQIIQELNTEIENLKNEIESKNQIIENLNHENDEINAHCEEIKSKYIQEIQDLQNQNNKLTQNINTNLSDLKRSRDELNRLKKTKNVDDQNILNLKSGSEIKDKDITNLKRQLAEKEEEIEVLAGELEKLKEGYSTLNVNFNEAANQLESLTDVEQKYNTLLQDYNLLKKENSENKNNILQNDKILNNMKNKLSKKDLDIKNLNNENERLKRDLMNLKIVENKYKQLSDENEELRLNSEKYDNLKREYDLLMTKLQKKNIIEKENENMKEKIRIQNNELKEAKNKHDSLIPLYEEQKRKFEKLSNDFSNLQDNIDQINLQATEYIMT